MPHKEIINGSHGTRTGGAFRSRLLPTANRKGGKNRGKNAERTLMNGISHTVRRTHGKGHGAERGKNIKKQKRRNAETEATFAERIGGGGSAEGGGQAAAQAGTSGTHSDTVSECKRRRQKHAETDFKVWIYL